jgi:hypothetical protein
MGVNFFSRCERSFRALSKAAVRSASARMRSMGLLPARVNWTARATLCATCPLMVVHRGTSYCGRPFLQKVDRDPAIDGCGCPIRAKAQDPDEHCPITLRHLPASQDGEWCNCKWCSLE